VRNERILRELTDENGGNSEKRAMRGEKERCTVTKKFTAGRCMVRAHANFFFDPLNESDMPRKRLDKMSELTSFTSWNCY
jgi:hypothetical protein